MQAGVGDEVPAAGRADGGDIAHVLHHGSQGDGRHGENRAAAEFGNGEGRDAYGGCSCQAAIVYPADDQGDDVGAYDTDQDGDDLDHALAPDVAADDQQHGDDRQQPVGLAVGDGAGRQDQADQDDDRTGNHRREQAHDPFDAEYLNQPRYHHIQQAGDYDTATCIGQHFLVGHTVHHGGYHRKSAKECERRSQECRYFPLCQEVEEQCAHACAQQRHGDTQACKDGDQHRCAKHGEYMLDTQNNRSTPT